MIRLDATPEFCARDSWHFLHARTRKQHAWLQTPSGGRGGADDRSDVLTHAADGGGGGGGVSEHI